MLGSELALLRLLGAAWRWRMAAVFVMHGMFIVGLWTLPHSRHTARYLEAINRAFPLHTTFPPALHVFDASFPTAPSPEGYLTTPRPRDPSISARSRRRHPVGALSRKLHTKHPSTPTREDAADIPGEKDDQHLSSPLPPSPTDQHMALLYRKALHRLPPIQPHRAAEETPHRTQARVISYRSADARRCCAPLRPLRR